MSSPHTDLFIALGLVVGFVSPAFSDIDAQKEFSPPQINAQEEFHGLTPPSGNEFNPDNPDTQKEFSGIELNAQQEFTGI